MEALIHLVLELIKTAILGSLYATLALWIFRAVGRRKPGGWCDRVSKRKFGFWLLGGFVISIGLLAYLFTCGDHGLGESARVPVGHSKAALQLDGRIGWIETSEGQVNIGDFAVEKGKLFAETGNKRGDYVVWNLRTDELTFYETEHDYLAAAAENNYPTPERFEWFAAHYRRHWGGWRFWLLP